MWGEQGMAALWAAATIKLIGAGIDDARLAEDLSRLVGEHDVTGRLAHPRRIGVTAAGRPPPAASASSTRPDPRAMPKGTALLLATGSKPALLDLLPWYDGRRSGPLTEAVAAATREMTLHAQGGSRFGVGLAPRPSPS